MARKKPTTARRRPRRPAVPRSLRDIVTLGREGVLLPAGDIARLYSCSAATVLQSTDFPRSVDRPRMVRYNLKHVEAAWGPVPIA